MNSHTLKYFGLGFVKLPARVFCATLSRIRMLIASLFASRGTPYFLGLPRMSGEPRQGEDPDLNWERGTRVEHAGVEDSASRRSAAEAELALLV